MTMEEFKMGIKTQRIGRMAKTKSISLSPDQLVDVMAFEELTGMELDRSRLHTEWVVGMSREELKTLYSGPSELILGD